MNYINKNILSIFKRLTLNKLSGKSNKFSKLQKTLLTFISNRSNIPLERIILSQYSTNEWICLTNVLDSFVKLTIEEQEQLIKGD